MTRLVRNSVILAKPEGTYGVDPTVDAGTDALLVSNLTINPINAQNVDRELLRAYMGASEQLVGTRVAEISFDVELAGSGTAGNATAWGKLLEACGYDETDAGAYITYFPLTTGLSSLWIEAYDSGAKHIISGSRGSFEIMAGQGERPVVRFSFIGLYTTPSASAVPSATLTAFQKPLVITNANSGDVTLGVTYSAGANSGGTAYPSRGLQINSGNNVVHTPLLGGEEVDITDRQVTGTVEFDLTASQEASFMAVVEANSTQTLGFTHGTTGGGIVLLYAPAVQLLNPKKVDYNGRRLIGFDLRFLPSAGNDELTIVTK